MKEKLMRRTYVLAMLVGLALLLVVSDLSGCGGSASSRNGASPSSGSGASTDNSAPAQAPASVTTSAPVGAQGGTVNVVSGPLTGTQVSVPAGAMESTMTIGVQPGLSSIQGQNIAAAVGPAVALSPPGTSFAQPVTVALPYSPSLLAGVTGASPASLVVLHRNDASAHVNILIPTTVDTVGHTVTCQVTSFSTLEVASATSAFGPAVACRLSTPDTAVAGSPLTGLNLTFTYSSLCNLFPALGGYIEGPSPDGTSFVIKDYDMPDINLAISPPARLGGNGNVFLDNTSIPGQINISGLTVNAPGRYQLTFTCSLIPGFSSTSGYFSVLPTANSSPSPSPSGSPSPSPSPLVLLYCPNTVDATTASISTFVTSPQGALTAGTALSVSLGSFKGLNFQAVPGGRFGYAFPAGSQGNQVQPVAIDPSNGSLSTAGLMPVSTNGPIFAGAIDPQGKFLYIFVAKDGFIGKPYDIQSLAINADGTLGTPFTVISGASKEDVVSPRAISPFYPVMGFVMAGQTPVLLLMRSGLNVSAVLSFAEDPATGSLVAGTPLAFPSPGPAAFGLALASIGGNTYGYVSTSDTTKNARSFNIAPVTGNLSANGPAVTVTAGGPGGVMTVGQVGGTSVLFVASSNSTNNQLMAFALGADGTIGAQVGTTRSTATPAFVNGLVLDPSGTVLYASTSTDTSATICDFVLDPSTLAPSPGATPSFASGGFLSSVPIVLKIR